MEKEPISIIVPVYNEAPFIGRCLGALFAQTDAVSGVDYEVIVVDDGSTDATPDEIRQFPVACVRFDINRGKLSARKAGAEKARHAMLLFIDARVEADRDLIASFRRVGYAPLIAGRYRELEAPDMGAEERFFLLLRRRYYHPYFPQDASRPVIEITPKNFNRVPKGTTCLFISKELFLESIPVAFSKHTNDDTTLFKHIVFRKGVVIQRHFAIAVTYHHRTDPRGLWAWVVRRGTTFFDFYVRRQPFFLALFIASLFTIIAAVVYCLAHPAAFLMGALLSVVVYSGGVIFLCKSAADIAIVAPRLFPCALAFYEGLIIGGSIALRTQKR